MDLRASHLCGTDVVAVCLWRVHDPVDDAAASSATEVDLTRVGLHALVERAERRRRRGEHGPDSH